MVTYKEFEIIKHLLRSQEKTPGAFLSYLDHNLRYPVFDSCKEVLELIAALQNKGYLTDNLAVTELALREIEPCRVKNAFILGRRRLGHLRQKRLLHAQGSVSKKRRNPH